MEQRHAEEDVADGGSVDRCTADQQRRDAEHTDLRVGAVGGEVAHVLQVQNHAEAREDRGHDDGDDSRALDLDAGVTRDLHVLTDRAHVLSELGLAEPDDEQAQKRNQDERQNGDLHAVYVDGKQIVDALAHVEQAHGVSDAVAAGQLDLAVLNRNDRAHHIKHDQLVHAVDEEGNDVARNHFATARAVEHAAAERAEQNGDGNRENHCQHDAGNAPDLPV